MKKFAATLIAFLAILAPARADVSICATASCSGQSTTGTMSAASATLTLAAAKDFVNGQGIRVDHAGAATTTQVPTGLGVATVGTTGSTSYLYKISSVDMAGGVTAATASGGISDGNADLSWNNNNVITWSAPVAGTTPIAYAIWRAVDGGAYSFLRVVSPVGSPLGFIDFGTVDARPAWVPVLPPASDLPDWLVTTVSSGGGTTTLTLGATATSAVTAQSVFHDDTAAFASAISTLNGAGGGYNLTIPNGAARIHWTSTLTDITAPNACIVGEPGAQLLPAGIHGLGFKGPDPSGSYTMTSDLLNGTTDVSLSSVAGLSVGDLLFFKQENPGGFGGSGFYVFTSPIRSFSGNVVTLTDPSPVTFSPGFYTITLTGTWLVGDTITASFSGQTPPAVVATARSGYVSTNEQVAEDLANAITRAYADERNPIFAWTSGDTPAATVVYIPKTAGNIMTVADSSAGGTATKGTSYAAPQISKFTPIANNCVRDIIVDATDLIGNALTFWDVMDFNAKGVRVKNVKSGIGFLLYEFYSALIDDVQTIAGAGGAPNSTSYADIWLERGTLLQTSNLRSRKSNSFGLLVEAVTWYEGVNTYQSGAEGGRGHKLQGVGGFTMSNWISNNSATTNVGFSHGTKRGLVSNLISMGGERAVVSNGTCVWFADQFSRNLTFFGVQTEGCQKDDIELGVSDIFNIFIGTTIGDYGLSSIFNEGLAKFFSSNGITQLGGNNAATVQNFGPGSLGTFSPNAAINLDGEIRP